ncbi:ATP-binding protein [Paenibacillus puerhi]|uniref:ATP-binding protein n=1 Tax=Paenibacillus puerhi TaxID=2692622 RepID=UPI00135ACD38|nr:ATP-binding protein [Paenibacillus puerhi]
MLTTLLSNLLFLIFPVIGLYVLGADPRRGKRGMVVCALLGSVSLLLCEWFPIPLTDGFTFNLQYSILIIVSLYGGHLVSIVLTVMMILLHLIWGQASDGYSWLEILGVSALLQYGIPHFPRLSSRSRVAVVVGFSTLSILVSLYGYFHTAPKSAHPGLRVCLLLSLIIQGVSAGMVAAFIEAMRRQFELREELAQLEKLRVISDLAASVSHEVRNPLTVSRGFMQLLLEQRADQEPDSRYLRLALEEMARAEHIINDFLAYAKPEAERITRLRIADELGYAAGVMESYALLGKVEIRLQHEGDGEVLGDRQKFRQCLINLLKNGIEAMPGGGSLEIRAVYEPGRVSVIIQDSGSGMSPEEVRNLGTPYYTTKTKGTGLGTMVAFSIVRAMKGRIDVTSTKGVGTRFELRLPLC